MKKNIHLMIIRHLKTFNDPNNNEKIKYDNAFNNSSSFVEYIIKFIKTYENINKIEFITSPQERTIITGLIISSMIKSDIIKNNIKNIEIIDPIVNNIIDRDPYKKKKKKIYKYFKNTIKHIDENTLYIYISHSSIIYNMFNCIFKLFLDNHEISNYSNKIHSYSLSYLVNNDNKVIYEFNKKMN